MLLRLEDRLFFSGGQEYHQASVRNIVIGVILGVVAFSVLSFIVAVIAFDSQAAEAPFLFVPNRLGLIPDVSRDQIKSIAATGSTEIEFAKPGTYILYSTDPGSKDTVEVTSRVSQSRVNVDSIFGETSNLSPDLLKADPMAAFDIPNSGPYVLSPRIARSPGGFLPMLYVAPDFSGSKRTILLVSILLTLGIIVAAGETVYHFATAEQRNRERAVKQEKARKLDEWMKTVNK